MTYKENNITYDAVEKDNYNKVSPENEDATDTVDDVDDGGDCWDSGGGDDIMMLKY